MNIYRHRFYARCPNNGETVAYDLAIETTGTIMVEAIVEAGRETDSLPQSYHENIADMMLSRFGGVQRLKAWHHGVEIETVREKAA